MAKATKKLTRKKKITKKRTTIFAEVSPSSKAWLIKQCEAKPGVVSKATMLEGILQGLKNKPSLFKQLGV